MTFRIVLLGIVTALSHLAACEAAHAQMAPVKVTVWGQHFGGKVIYRYVLQNQSDRAIRRFLIGLRMPDAGDGAVELSISPRRPVDSFWLGDQAAARPAGWGVRVYFPDESAKFALEWVEAGYHKQMWPLSGPSENAPIPEAGDQSIAPGTTVSVSATVDSFDPGYVTGHATIHLDTLVSIPIIKGDTNAPTVKINALRLNQNEGRGEWALFRISADVTDDFDPNPAVSVAPVSSNQPLAGNDVTMDKNGSSAWNASFRNVPGRSYTFSVRAMDASGNVTVEDFVYRVDR